MEEVGLKQRLIGAVVLVILGVIVIPMLLGGEGHSPLTKSNIPPPPLSEFSSKIIPLEDVPPTGSLNPVPTELAPVVEPPSSPAVSPATPKKAPAQALPLPESVDKKPAATATGWVVRLGSFASEQNAQALRDQLRSKGYQPLVEKITANGTTLLRVSVGPEPDRGRAEAVRDRLLKEVKLKGGVVPYP